MSYRCPKCTSRRCKARQTTSTEDAGNKTGINVNRRTISCLDCRYKWRTVELFESRYNLLIKPINKAKAKEVKVNKDHYKNESYDDF